MREFAKETSEIKKKCGAQILCRGGHRRLELPALGACRLQATGDVMARGAGGISGAGGDGEGTQTLQGAFQHECIIDISQVSVHNGHAIGLRSTCMEGSAYRRGRVGGFAPRHRVLREVPATPCCGPAHRRRPGLGVNHWGFVSLSLTVPRGPVDSTLIAIVPQRLPSGWYRTGHGAPSTARHIPGVQEDVDRDAALRLQVHARLSEGMVNINRGHTVG
jgi:hypothetical protein